LTAKSKYRRMIAGNMTRSGCKFGPIVLAALSTDARA